MPDYFRGVNAVAVVTVGERQCGLATILDLEGNLTFGEGTATLRRETRRSERAAEMAAERTANDRAREVRRRNEDEGFELVRSYRGQDGRRISVYQRMERRAVAYQQARPLFGRPAFVMPREFWR